MAPMEISVQLDADMERRLDEMAARTGCAKVQCLREIIERGLDDLEDYYLATEVLKRVRSGAEKVYSATDVRNAIELED